MNTISPFPIITCPRRELKEEEKNVGRFEWLEGSLFLPQELELNEKKTLFYCLIRQFNFSNPHFDLLKLVLGKLNSRCQRVLSQIRP